MSATKTQAFTLVELSIVLVILGLLTGGILAGQSLIRAAELRSITTEYQRYQAAIQSFRDRYQALPGDMKNATLFWGAATCPTTAGTGTATCDGNGNGQINTAPAADRFGEMFTFWQHLANAGLIEGSYSGMSGSGSSVYVHIPGINSPRSRLSNSGWNVESLGNFAGNPNLFAYNYGHNMALGAAVADFWSKGDNISPQEAWNIDMKLDDGKPGTGKVFVKNWDICTDAATNGSATQSDRINAQYLLGETGILCSLYFPQVF